MSTWHYLFYELESNLWLKSVFCTSIEIVLIPISVSLWNLVRHFDKWTQNWIERSIFVFLFLLEACSLSRTDTCVQNMEFFAISRSLSSSCWCYIACVEYLNEKMPSSKTLHSEFSQSVQMNNAHDVTPALHFTIYYYFLLSLRQCSYCVLRGKFHVL